MVSKAKSEAFTIRMLWSARTKTLYTYIAYINSRLSASATSTLFHSSSLKTFLLTKPFPSHRRLSLCSSANTNPTHS